MTPAQPGPPTARAPFRAAEIAPVVKIDGATAQTRVQRAFASTVTGAAGASNA